MNHDPMMDPPQNVEYGSLKSYVTGFLLSIVLTLASYYLAVQNLASGWALDVWISLFAIGQAVIQLILFLNLLREPKPRWNLVVFLFMLLIVVIVVSGSIWIMNSLKYNLRVQ